MGGALKVSKSSSERYWNPLGHYGRQAIFGTRTPEKKRKPAGAKEDPMMAFMSQMQSNQAAQAEAARKAQEEALLEAQKQSALASARQGEMSAQQSLSQAGAMQQAKDIAALQAQQQAATAAGASAIGGAYDIGKAQQEQAANLAGIGAIPTGAALPFYGMGETQTTPVTRSANIFNLPKTTDIKFGGI